MQTLSFLNIFSESPQYQDARHDLIKRGIARPLGFEAEGRRFESKVHVCCLYVASHDLVFKSSKYVAVQNILAFSWQGELGSFYRHFLANLLASGLHARCQIQRP